MTLPKWLYLVQLLAPAILNSFGVPSELAGAISDGIQEAESIPGATGPDKKAHVLSIVGDAITAINAAKGRQLLDPLRVSKVAGDGIDLVVEAVDLVHDRTTDPNNLNLPSPTPTPASTAAPAAPTPLQTALESSVEKDDSTTFTEGAPESEDAPPPTTPPPAPAARPESTQRKAKGPSKTRS